jgi:hypothetical protein
MTPICGHRWQEIERWLDKHPETKRYAILDDVARLYEGSSAALRSHLVLCNNRHGLVPALFPKLRELLQ